MVVWWVGGLVVGGYGRADGQHRGSDRRSKKNPHIFMTHTSHDTTDNDTDTTTAGPVVDEGALPQGQRALRPGPLGGGAAVPDQVSFGGHVCVCGGWGGKLYTPGCPVYTPLP